MHETDIKSITFWQHCIITYLDDYSGTVLLCSVIAILFQTAHEAVVPCVLSYSYDQPLYIFISKYVRLWRQILPKQTPLWWHSCFQSNTVSQYFKSIEETGNRMPQLHTVLSRSAEGYESGPLYPLLFWFGDHNRIKQQWAWSTRLED